MEFYSITSFVFFLPSFFQLCYYLSKTKSLATLMPKGIRKG